MDKGRVNVGPPETEERGKPAERAHRDISGAKSRWHGLRLPRFSNIRSARVEELAARPLKNARSARVEELAARPLSSIGSAAAQGTVSGTAGTYPPAGGIFMLARANFVTALKTGPATSMPK